jgi:hypothetical protein
MFQWRVSIIDFLHYGARSFMKCHMQCMTEQQVAHSSNQPMRGCHVKTNGKSVCDKSGNVGILRSNNMWLWVCCNVWMMYFTNWYMYTKNDMHQFLEWNSTLLLQNIMVKWYTNVMSGTKFMYYAYCGDNAWCKYYMATTYISIT